MFNRFVRTDKFTLGSFKIKNKIVNDSYVELLLSILDKCTLCEYITSFDDK